MPGSVCGLYIMRKDRLFSDKHADGEFFQLGGVMLNGSPRPMAYTLSEAGWLEVELKGISSVY